MILLALLLAAAAPPVDPELIALCSSSDVAARRYCLHAVARDGDPGGDAKDAIWRLRSDPVLGVEAAEIFEELYAGNPVAVLPPGAPLAPPPPARRFSGDPSRVIYAPTAFTQPAGTSTFNAFELGTFRLDHGITDHVSIGLQTAIPIGAFVAGPTVHVGVPFDGGAVGFYASAFYAGAFVGSGGSLFVVGGGPMLTLGNPDNFINVGVLGFYGTSGHDAAGLVVPHLGASLRVSERVRFGIEGYAPGLFSGAGDSNQGFGHFGAIAWGFRLFGDSVFGDVALVDPICSGCGDLYKVIPLGIPFLNFGTSW